MMVNAIKCAKCCDTIFSRSRHDYRWCTCKSVGIDGGRDYHKTSAMPGAEFESFMLQVFASQKELAKDWNTKGDKYGLILASVGVGSAVWRSGAQDGG